MIIENEEIKEKIKGVCNFFNKDYDVMTDKEILNTLWNFKIVIEADNDIIGSQKIDSNDIEKLNEFKNRYYANNLAIKETNQCIDYIKYRIRNNNPFVKKIKFIFKKREKC